MSATQSTTKDDTTRVTFASKEIADAHRKDHPDHLAPDDDARTRTVTFSSDAPDVVIERAESEAFVEHGEQTALPGEQVPLSDTERQSLERQHPTWNWQDHGFEAMRAKGALLAEGATEWQDFYEPGEGAAGALANLRASKERSAQTGAALGVGGEHRERESDDPTVQREQAQTVARGLAEECDHARDHCKMNDPEACEFLTEHCGVTEPEIDAIRDGEGQPSGRTLGALSEAWGGYQGAVRKAEDATDPEKRERHLRHARQAADAINSIRREHDQEPLTFNRLGQLKEQNVEPDSTATASMDDDTGLDLDVNVDTSPGGGEASAALGVAVVGGVILLGLGAAGVKRSKSTVSMALADPLDPTGNRPFS